MNSKKNTFKAPPIVGQAMKVFKNAIRKDEYFIKSILILLVVVVR